MRLNANWGWCMVMINAGQQNNWETPASVKVSIIRNQNPGRIMDGISPLIGDTLEGESG